MNSNGTKRQDITMVVKICAYCKKPMGMLAWLKFVAHMFQDVSHGVCEKCQAIELQKLENRHIEETPVPVRITSPN